MRTGAKWVIGLIVSATALRAEVPLDDYLRVRELMGIGKFSEAMAACRVLLQTHPDQLPFYDALAEAGLYGNDLVSAEGAFRGMLREGTREDFAYYGLGLVQFHRKDYRSAATLFDRAIARGAQEPDCYKMLEYAYEQAAGVESAIRYFKLLCNRFPENPNHWYGLGLAHWQKKEGGVILSSFAKALQANPTESRYLQAYAAALSLFGDEQLSLQMIDTLSAKAEREGDYQGYFFLQTTRLNSISKKGSGRGYQVQSPKLIENAKQLGFHRWVGWSSLKVADLESQQNRFWSCIEHSLIARNSADLAHEETLWASSMQRLFHAYSELGQFESCIENTVSRIKRAMLNSDQRTLLLATRDLGRVFTELGRGELGLDYLAIALSQASTFQNDVHFVIEMRVALALAYMNLGKYDEALDNLDEAQKMATRKEVWKYFSSAISATKAECLISIGRLGRARHELSAAIRRANLKDHEEMSPQLMLAKSNLLLALHQEDLARRSYWTTLGVVERMKLEAERISVLRGIARSSITLRDSSQALHALAELYQIHKKNLPLSVGVASPFAFSQRVRSDVREYIRLLVRSKRLEEGLQVAETERIRELSDPFSIPIADFRGQNAESLVTRLTSLRGELSRLYLDLPCSTGIPLFEQQPLKTVDLMNHMLEKELRFSRLFKGTIEPDVVSESWSVWGPISPSLIQEDLKLKNEAILEYVALEDCVILFVLTPDTLATFELPISHRLLESALSRLTPMLDSTRAEETVWNDILAQFDQKTSNDLFKMLVQPAMPIITHFKNLRIISEGSLRNLPFETLATVFIDKDAGNPQPKPTYLLDRFVIHYEQTASPRLNAILANRLQNVLLVASSEGSDWQGVEWAEDPSSEWHGMKKRERNTIRGTNKETSFIGQLFGLREEPSYGRGIRKSEFLRNGRGSRIIHFATHSLWNEDYPSKACVILNDFEQGVSDRFLTVCELACLDLRPDLVVFSGCNTARWSLKATSYGFLKPFALKAGIAFVGSLWPVDDDATRILMEHFYTHLKEGMTTGEALQQAKLDLIHIGKSDPFYWGGFVLVGNNAQIDLSDQSIVDSFGPALVTASGACIWLFVLFSMGRSRLADLPRSRLITLDIDGWVRVWLANDRHGSEERAMKTSMEERNSWGELIL